MIDWTSIKSAVRPAISDLTALPAAQVKWRDESAGSGWITDPTIYLRLKDITEVGYQQEVRSDNAPADQTVTVTQQKQFTLSIRAESFSQPIDSPKHAGALIDVLRTRLKRTTSTERFHGLFSILLYQRVQFFEYVNQDRQVCAYVMDLTCGAVDNDIDTTTGAGGYINEVIGTGTVGGVPSPTINLDIKGP